MADVACFASLPVSAWCHVASNLHTHQLLGQVASLSMECLTKLGEKRCWSTLALPQGRRRVAKLLDLMLLEEKELWIDPLRHVQVLELNLKQCSQRAEDCLRELLFRGLNYDGVIRKIRLRCIPAFYELERPNNGPGRLTAKDLRLVNPVVSRGSASLRCSFLLDTNDLRQLRFKMSGFRHFRLAPTPLELEPTLDVVARLDEKVTTSIVHSAVDDEEVSPAEMMLERELGAMARLNGPQTWSDRGGKARRWDYTSWLREMLPIYQILTMGKQPSQMEGAGDGLTGELQ
eukprot:TRINITY_DN36471_c0_g1_i1.p1 TRINITY_DN36471_c0_g1~~TRINITY_DN36471_c0_g1_i1.p1  ORF type:complete len:296 (-),score=39.85 TRINITY_DN36471_c0_g1_i1:116-982(-)